jgi:hypothetical protein
MKAISLAESSAKYAHDMGAVEVEIYLNEPESWAESVQPRFFKVEDSHGDDSSSATTMSPETASSPHMRPASPKVMLFEEKGTTL